jgi:molybdenum cofactor cytidylyltransferase
VLAAIVLAAGESTRFGTEKLLVLVRGKPVVRWTVEHVLPSRIDQVLVVTGRREEGVRRALEGLAVRYVANERVSEGLSSSLRAGLTALPPRCAGALIVLGDQPGVSAAICDRLVETHEASGAPIVVPVYDGVSGNPVLFDASMFPELTCLRGDRGARAVIARHGSAVARVEFPFPPPLDLDAENDLAAIARELDALAEEAGEASAPGGPAAQSRATPEAETSRDRVRTEE